MQRLIDCLEGEARKCVEMILLTDDPERAINRLKGHSLRNRTKLDEGSSKSLKLGNLVYHSIS
jgi:hypothetical protein